MVVRAAEGGAPVPAAVLTYRASVRTTCDRLEALEPIPDDFGDDRNWPTLASRRAEPPSRPEATSDRTPDEPSSRQARS